MSSVGSFGTFTTARLAIYVSQKGLSVTGNNIANINTVGYTRQRLDQVSFKTGASDRYQNPSDMHVGNGAIAKTVSQLRDPYLDVRYRAEHSSEGYYNGRLNGLDQLADILDEVGKGEKDGDGLLYAQFSDFFDSLQHIQAGAGTEVNDTLAANSAETLCKLFYNAANQLERLNSNMELQLREELNGINGTLLSIRKLNEAIQQAEIYGDKALELRDERNNLIDDLSEKLKIDVTYSMVHYGGKEVEKLTIRLGDANPDDGVVSDSSLLVDGDYCAQLTTPKANDKYEAQYQVFDKNSAAYQKAVKDLSRNPPIGVTVGGTTYTKLEDLDKAAENFLKDPATELKAFQFVDENGEGTNDPRDAAQVFDDYYNITVSDLRDKNNKAWEASPDIRNTFQKDTTGFPTKAKYTAQFGFSGVWKDGDTITVNNQKVVIGSAPTPPEANTVYLSASEANDEAKNVSNAIRKALMNTGDFKDYDITTQTASNGNGYDVLLTVKAKDPKLMGTQPTINITANPTANPTPSIAVGNAVAATDAQGNAITGQYRAEVTTGNPDKFHRGDKITIGTGNDAITLEVGKNISVNAANSPERLAAKLAEKINLTGYTVSSTTDKDGKAYLVFKAGKDVTGAPTVPTVKAEAAKPVTFNPLSNVTWDSGSDPAEPAITLMNTPPETKDNGDNTTSRITTRYFMDENDQWHKVVKTVTTSNTKQLDDNDLFGKLQAVRELLTEEGEFSSRDEIDNIDESAAIKRGIPYYREALDLLARKFAETMNEANTGFAVDQSGNYLTSTDGGETFTKLLVNNEPLSKAGMTDDQKAIVEQDTLGNFVKANFAGFVKNADGSNSNVLADKYGNPLKVGGTTLTKDMLKIDGATWDASVIKDAVNINEQGQFLDADGNVIMMEDPDDATKTIPATVKLMEFQDNAFGTVPTPADPNNPTAAEQEAIDKAEAEIKAKSDAANAELKENALDSYLGANGAYRMGGNLFSNRGDTDNAEGITAKNISVSHSWNKGLIHVVPTYIKLFDGEGTNTTQNDNALHMGHLMNAKLLYNPQDLTEDSLSDYLFEGTFQEMLVKMNTTLGSDQKLTKASLQTHMGQALDIDTSRDSVSAVDLNDEAMDLMQYTHSLNAAYRLMTTIDDMIERLITGTGVTR